MPASSTDYSKIKEYQETAATKGREASGMEGAAFTLGDSVMKAVRDDRVSRGVSKLSTDVGNVMGQMVTDPTGIRERTSGVVNPFDVNDLTSGARAQNLRTLGTVSTWESQNQGSLDEVIQAGANQLNARAKALYAQAEEAQMEAQSLQQEWQRAFEERQFEEEQRQFNENQRSSGSGETSSVESLLQLAAILEEREKEKKYNFEEDTEQAAPAQPFTFGGALSSLFSKNKSPLPVIPKSNVKSSTGLPIPGVYGSSGTGVNLR
jgi:ribosomal protein L12E/L44/L45/RPP1/RPP2